MSSTLFRGRCWYLAVCAAVHATQPEVSSRFVAFEALKQAVLNSGGVVAVKFAENLNDEQGAAAGLIAAQALQPGDTAMSMPESLMLSSKTASERVQEASKLALEQYCEEHNTDKSTLQSLPEASVLGTIFIQELRKKDSIYRSYFKTLPKELAMTYVMWPKLWQTVYNRVGLKETQVYYEAALLDLVLRIGRLLDPKNPFTENEVLAVVVLMASRRFTGQRMVPGLDLANHGFAPKKNCVFRCHDDAAACSLVASRPVSVGEEILWQYKGAGNLRMLAAFGFMSDDNPYTSGVVYFPPPPSTSKVTIKPSGVCDDYFNAEVPFLRNATGNTFLEPTAMQCLVAAFDGSESKAFEYIRYSCLHNRQKAARAWKSAEPMAKEANKGGLHRVGVHILDELLSEASFADRCLERLPGKAGKGGSEL